MNTIIKDFLNTVGLGVVATFLSDDAEMNTKTLEISDHGITVKVEPHEDYTTCIRNGEKYSVDHGNDPYENPFLDTIMSYQDRLWFEVPEGVQIAHEAVYAGRTVGIKDPLQIEEMISEEEKYISNINHYSSNNKEQRIKAAEERIAQLEQMKNRLISWSDGRKELHESMA